MSTQELRSAQTRTAVLDATVACLLDHGYAGLTTRRVADYAGVTRGAQQHHFDGKDDLVAASVTWLAERAMADAVVRVSAIPDGPERVEGIVDVLWEVHQGPLFEATLELWVAARTAPGLRTAMVRVEKSVADVLAAGLGELFGTDRAGDPGFRAAVEGVIAMMRGFALRRILGSDLAAIDDWWSRWRPRAIAALQGTDR